MPEQDGPVVLEKLRNAGYDLPVLFLTGLNQPIFEEKGPKLGAVDFVDKSKSFAIILQRTRTAVTEKSPNGVTDGDRSEEETSEPQSQMRSPYAGVRLIKNTHPH